MSALIGTHDQRLITPPGSLANGSTWYETDRQATYTVINGVWVLTSGVPASPTASLPTDLGTSDDGYTAIDPSTGATNRWNGTGWDAV